MKTCSKCGEEKDVGEFYTGRNHCKVCVIAHQLEYNKTEKGRAVQRKHRKSEKGKDRKRKYNKTEKGRAHKRKYKKTEKGKVSNRRCVRKYNKTPIFIQRNRLRGRLRYFLKRGDTIYNRSLMGCTRDELRTRITILFRTGMTWENHGEWQLDHIIPMSKFDLSKDEEVKKCMHYSNLQPLWRKENGLKGNK